MPGVTARSAPPAAADAALLTPADARGLAARELPDDVRRFVDGVAGGGLTARSNRAALDRLALVPRVLTDVSSVSAGTRLLGTPAAFPAAVAPMAYQRAVHPEGELAVARAARAAGVPFTVSLFSSQTLEAVAATGVTTWFQLYWLRDRSVTADLLQRAEAAGCSAVVLTVDTPLMGRRLSDLRYGFSLPEGVSAPILGPLAGRGSRSVRRCASEVADQTAALVDPSLNWADLDWLRARTRLPLILKGVLNAADARRAVEYGADAVVVSNHGGRQLDGAVASVEALPRVAEAVGGRCEVLMDSGIRSGTDLLKALSLGAGGVLLGRPVLWGLAAQGGRGALRVLRLFREELEHAMSLAGCPDPASAGELESVRAPAPLAHFGEDVP
ncbi:alpha-hydroxy acid oxidase [Streptomyces flaveolus]|uniref:alpha-hydroxy acid oxidase n=1 Tax=Streptomyces flaveolus TaxID=67297 RepID=UPI00343EE67D